MKKNIAMLFCCLLFSATSLFATENVQIMTTQELRNILYIEDVTILDARGERGWGESEFKIPKAQRLTWNNFRELSASLPKENILVLYCS
ncbi:hypothetical protein VU04_07235 [Desulfobulbus sp. TB]|nr:hypothetical protein [Desulfobulbus sp. TB]